MSFYATPPHELKLIFIKVDVKSISCIDASARILPWSSSNIRRSVLSFESL